MDIDQPQAEGDPFLAFIDYARFVLLPEEEDDHDLKANRVEVGGLGWSWIASRILKTCIAYSVTAAILFSDLFQAWNEQQRGGGPKRVLECMIQLRKKHRRTKLPNTISVDSIYEKNYLSLTSVLEIVILDAFTLLGTNIYMLTLGDFQSFNTIDLYLHRRYYDLVNPQNGILKKGREIFLTGCYLRTASEGCGRPRLLPTEYLVILLDEEEDDDAMLLGAQFCSYSFSSISFDAVNRGVSFSLYARVGSMLALDRPYISSSIECAIGTSEEFCLEYGSATQLFLVPSIQHEDQLSVALTQNEYQAPRLLNSLDSSQDSKVSQVLLPCDSQGSIDFSNYPFRSFVTDLRDKMSGISL